MQFAIHNEGREGLTLTASGPDDAAILARLPDEIVLRREGAGYTWKPAPSPAPRTKSTKKAEIVQPEEALNDEQ